MGKGNKSVSQIHPIIRHMNKLGGNPDIKYNPIQHDEKGMGRGGHLGAAKGGTVYGPAEYKSMGPKLEMPPHMNKTKPEDKKKKDDRSHRDYEGGPTIPFSGSFFGLKVKGRA